jgi:hypothetical protein
MGTYIEHMGIPVKENLQGLSFVAAMWHRAPMTVHITHSGRLVLLWTWTGHDEVMLHCARIGFKP